VRAGKLPAVAGDDDADVGRLVGLNDQQYSRFMEAANGRNNLMAMGYPHSAQAAGARAHADTTISGPP
jgi:hypothetical protein